MTTEFSGLFEEVAANMRRAANGPYLAAMARAVELLEGAFRSRRKLLVFGNGGSSADAQHLAAELVGRFTVDRPAFPAIALGANQALVTAWSNDRAFQDVFVRELEALGSAGDVAWGISTSGMSANVVNALRRARELGLHTIGLTGAGGGAMKPLCDVLLEVPLAATARIQEVHLVTCHAICAALESRLGRSG